MIDEQVFLEGVKRIIEEGIKPVLKGRSKFITIQAPYYESPQRKIIDFSGVTTELEHIHGEIRLEEIEETGRYYWRVWMLMYKIPLPIRYHFGEWYVQIAFEHVDSLQKEPSIDSRFVEDVRTALEGTKFSWESVEPDDLDFSILLKPEFVRELYDEVVSIYFLKLLAGC
ncbi:MAG: hypothetical protein DRP01_09055 [Archaeoglobales archaeon]|nr:MAG: hypothetical protein DRP01_09055 [Archaeoglobales archaeon]